MPVFQPPPTYANPVLEEIDPATGRTKAGFNPVWLKWFLDLAAALSFVPGGGGSSSTFAVPYKQIIYGNSANFATVSDTFEWQDDIRTLFLGNAEEEGVISGGAYEPIADRGHPGTVTVVGSINPGNHGGHVRVTGGAAGTGGGNGGNVEVTGGAARGSGQGGSVTVAANNSGDAGGPAGDVGIASGAGDNGGNGGNVIITAPSTLGGGGARGYIYLQAVTRVEAFLVADLPAPGAGQYRAIVTDAVAPAFLAVVVGGGTVTTPVFFDGSNWRCG